MAASTDGGRRRDSLPFPVELVAVELNGRIVAGGRLELYPFRLPLPFRSGWPSSAPACASSGRSRRYERRRARDPGDTPADVRRRVLEYGDDRTFADWLGPAPG